MKQEKDKNVTFTVGKCNISRKEVEQFIEIIGKLSRMTDRRRRLHPCWKAIKQLATATGNWENAPRGKPRSELVL